MSEIPRTTPELTDERIDEIFLACGGHYGVSLQGPNQHVFARAILAAQAPAEPVALSFVQVGWITQDGFPALYGHKPMPAGATLFAAAPNTQEPKR